MCRDSFRWPADRNLLASAPVARPDLVTGPVFKSEERGHAGIQVAKPDKALATLV